MLVQVIVQLTVAVRGAGYESRDIAQNHQDRYDGFHDFLHSPPMWEASVTKPSRVGKALVRNGGSGPAFPSTRASGGARVCSRAT